MIKIDRSFVADLPGNKVDWDITKGIVSIAHALGLAVVAEGAEEFEQIGSLRELGCDQVQGYFIHRPMPFDDANQWLKHKPLRVNTTHKNTTITEKMTKAAANQERVNNTHSQLTTALSIQQGFFDPRFSLAQRNKNRSA